MRKGIVLNDLERINILNLQEMTASLDVSIVINPRTMLSKGYPIETYWSNEGQIYES